MEKLSLRLLISVSVILLLLGVTILLVYPIFHASRMSWPKIKDYERLFSEATILTQLNTPGFVKNEDWPQSIRTTITRLLVFSERFFRKESSKSLACKCYYMRQAKEPTIQAWNKLRRNVAVENDLAYNQIKVQPGC